METNKTYSDKLRLPQWQRKRLEIFNRDNFTCQVCGDKESPLNVHHLCYDNCEPWEYDDHELITLCECCHSFVEKTKDKVDVTTLRGFKCVKSDPEYQFALIFYSSYENLILAEFDRDGFYRSAMIFKINGNLIGIRNMIDTVLKFQELHAEDNDLPY